MQRQKSREEAKPEAQQANLGPENEMSQQSGLGESKFCPSSSSAPLALHSAIPAAPSVANLHSTPAISRPLMSTVPYFLTSITQSMSNANPFLANASLQACVPTASGPAFLNALTTSSNQLGLSYFPCPDDSLSFIPAIKNCATQCKKVSPGRNVLYAYSTAIL